MCTTIIVTPGATVDGSMFVTHSDDNDLADERLVYVPAADYEPGSLRPVYPLLVGYPRLVCKGRGPAYETPGFPPTEALGYIPQVEHTFAYYDNDYAVMNEHQLCFGECTDAAQREAYTREEGDADHLFCSPELGRVALEQCKTAREAVVLMGHLIDTYGYYGPGETLPVGDPTEGWVFEMCAMRDGKGLWVAKRVPDGEVFVAANEFRIREIILDDPENFLYSPNLLVEAEKQAFQHLDEGLMLDWLRLVSHGEYNHPYYSLRRVWSVLNRVNPALNLPPWVKDGYTDAYPFSIKPEKPLALEDVMGLHRDHYEGTEFDMTQGLAAGPFGNPNRYYHYKSDQDTWGYDNSSSDLTVLNPNLWGAFERPVSVYYCGYVYVCQARRDIPDAVGGVLWFGFDQPSSTCFVPFYAGGAGLPHSYEYGSTAKFDKDFAFWIFNAVANLACLKYSYMIEDIKKKQQELEGIFIEMQGEIKERALELFKQDPQKASGYLAGRSECMADTVLAEWWELFYTLLHKYSDGYINGMKKRKGDGAMVNDPREVGYPLWWRDQVRYAQGPTRYDKHP